jgi:Domain of unknown function (DUF4304)
MAPSTPVSTSMPTCVGTVWFDHAMTARDAFTAMLRQHAHPPLRAAGYTRAAATWRRQSPHGDIAVVNMQKSRWDIGDEVTFYVNLAIVPASWWQFIREEWGKTTAAPRESHGLLRRRLDVPADHPTLGRTGWQVRDAASADVCGHALRDQLHHVAIPELAALLNREYLLDFIHAGAAGWWVAQPPNLAMAYVIADQGTSPKLTTILDTFDPTPRSPRAAANAAWLRRRAAEAGAEP